MGSAVGRPVTGDARQPNRVTTRKPGSYPMKPVTGDASRRSTTPLDTRRPGDARQRNPSPVTGSTLERGGVAQRPGMIILGCFRCPADGLRRLLLKCKRETGVEARCEEAKVDGREPVTAFRKWGLGMSWDVFDAQPSHTASYEEVFGLKSTGSAVERGLLRVPLLKCKRETGVEARCEEAEDDGCRRRQGRIPFCRNLALKAVE